MDQFSNSNSAGALPAAAPQSGYHTSSPGMPPLPAHGSVNYSDSNAGLHQAPYAGPLQASADAGDVMHLAFKGTPPMPPTNAGTGVGSGNSSLSNNQGRQKFSELGFSVINSDKQQSAT